MTNQERFHKLVSAEATNTIELAKQRIAKRKAMKIDQEDFNRKAQHILDTVVIPQVERYEKAKAEKLNNMKLENLNPQELEQLQTLLNKMNPTQSTIDPVEQMIKDILDEFEFDRVAKVLDYLDWQWRGESVTLEMLKETAERLLRGAADRRLSDRSEHPDAGIINATGGLEATAYCDADNENIVRLELRFVLVSWDESIDE